MEIIFKNARMKEESENHNRLSRQLGRLQANKIIARLNELCSAENLHDIWRLPQARLHALSGDSKGHFAINLKHPYRMIISPLNGDTADLKTVTKIHIDKLYWDYH